MSRGTKPKAKITKHKMPNLTTKEWTAILVAIVVVVVIFFFLWLSRMTPKTLSPQEVLDAMQKKNSSAKLSPTQREEIVHSMTARPASSSVSEVDRERIIRAMTAQPAKK